MTLYCRFLIPLAVVPMALFRSYADAVGTNDTNTPYLSGQRRTDLPYWTGNAAQAQTQTRAHRRIFLILRLTPARG